MYTHQEITEFFIGLLAQLSAEGALTEIEDKAFERYANEFYTFYADGAEGRDIEWL